jgi:hypothetical protein
MASKRWLVISDRKTEYVVRSPAVFLSWLVSALVLVLTDMTGGVRDTVECQLRDEGLEIMMTRFPVRYIMSYLEEDIDGRTPLTAKRPYVLFCFCFRRTKVCLQRQDVALLGRLSIIIKAAASCPSTYNDAMHQGPPIGQAAVPSPTERGEMDRMSVLYLGLHMQ